MRRKEEGICICWFGLVFGKSNVPEVARRLMIEWREGGDLNPRVLADNGLAIHRLAGLGHLRFSASKAGVVINSFCMAFLASPALLWTYTAMSSDVAQADLRTNLDPPLDGRAEKLFLGCWDGKGDIPRVNRW